MTKTDMGTLLERLDQEAQKTFGYLRESNCRAEHNGSASYQAMPAAAEHSAPVHSR